MKTHPRQEVMKGENIIKYHELESPVYLPWKEAKLVIDTYYRYVRFVRWAK